MREEVLVFTNDLKKGDRVQLKNGWMATIEDNRKGNTRLCTVEGYVTEMGSVYAWDIARYIALGGVVDVNEPIELTPRQLKARDVAWKLGF